MEVGWSGKEVGWSGKAHQRWENAGSGPRRDGSWKSEPLSDPLVEEQLDGWVESLEEVGRRWRGRTRTDVLGVEQDAQNLVRRSWYFAIWYPVI